MAADNGADAPARVLRGRHFAEQVEQSVVVAHIQPHHGLSRATEVMRIVRHVPIRAQRVRIEIFHRR